MATCKIKVFNPHQYDVHIKSGDGPNLSPSGCGTVRAGRTESMTFSHGKWLFYDKTTNNRHSPLLGQVQFDNQMFTVPQVPD